MEYAKYSQAIEVPPAMTQDGLAEAADVELRHLTQYARPLVREELVRERTAHVTGARQRRKVYDLTEKGQVAAYRLRERVRAETLRVRDADGVRETSFGEALDALRGQSSLIDLVRRASRSPVLDLAALARPSAPVFIEMLAGAPRIRHFVGRTAEVEAVSTSAGGARLFVVRGVAGIGKSSFGAKVCERLRGTTNLYWHTLRPWDTRPSILAGLGEFLAALGKPGLTSVLARGEPSEAIEILGEDLRDAKAFLVFDDAHDATPDAVALFRFLKDAIADAPEVRVLVLSRRAVPFYDRRDVALRGLVREIELGGLAAEEIAALLTSEGEVVLTNLGRSLGGHPLFLELVRSTPRPAVRREALGNVHRFIEEEIYVDLTDAERRVLKVASLYHVPVPQDALFVDPEVTHDVLVSLTSRSLLKPVGDDGIAIHDTLREFFSGTLTPDERHVLCRRACDHLESLATAAREAGKPMASIDYLSNALQLAEAPEEKAVVWETLGDMHEKIGDLPAVLTSYKEAAKLVREPEPVARLHRKTAWALELRGAYDAARKEMDAGFQALGSVLSRERGWLDVVRGCIAADQELWEEVREAGTAALETFQAFHDAAGETRGHWLLGTLELESPRGDPHRAEEQFLAALRTTGDRPEVELTARLHTSLAHLYGYRFGDESRAMDQIAALEALPEAMRDPFVRRSYLMLQGWFNFDVRADYATSERFFREAIQLGRRVHSGLTIAYANYGLGLSRMCQGRVEEARADLERYASDIQAHGLPADAVEGLWMAAICSLRLGDLQTYRRLAGETRKAEYASGRQSRPVHMRILDGVDLWISGDRAGGRSAFEEALRLSEESFASGEGSLSYFAHLFLGVALRLLGQEEEARRHLEEGQAQLRSYNMKARLSMLPKMEQELADTLRPAAKAS